MKPICPICQSTQTRQVFPVDSWENIEDDASYEVRKCRECYTAFTSPTVGPETLSTYYEQGLYRDVKNRFSWLIDVISLVFQKERLHKVVRVCNRGRLLDVGCGKGRFLAYVVQQGWGAFGVEPSEDGWQVARGRVGERVFRELQQIDKMSHYDIITLWHVLEHVSTPLEMLDQLWSYLCPDGWLLVAVPNFASIQARLGRQKWGHLDIPRHRVHYTPETLRLTLKRSGYDLVYVDHFSLEFNVIGMYQTVLNVLGSEPNLIYKLIKRNFSLQSMGYTKFFFSLFVFLLASPFVLPLSFFLSLYESLIGRGGTIVGYAKLS